MFMLSQRVRTGGCGTVNILDIQLWVWHIITNIQNQEAILLVFIQSEDSELECLVLNQAGMQAEATSQFMKPISNIFY